MSRYRPAARPGWTAAILAVAAVWLGLLAGVSFLATPAKFLAPSLPLTVALDVGRHTFAVFNKVEWLFCATMVAGLMLGTRTAFNVAGVAVAVLVVILETFWLLPTLDQRVGMIIAGQQPPPSSLHTVYIVLEFAKLVALLVVVVDTARRLAGIPPAIAPPAGA